MNFEHSEEKLTISYTDNNQKLVGIYLVALGILALIPTFLIGGSFVSMLIGSVFFALLGVALVATAPTITSVADKTGRLISIESVNRTKFFHTSKQIGFTDVKQIDLASYLYSNHRKGQVLYIITNTGDKIKMAGWQNYKFPFDQTETNEEYFVNCGQRLASFLNVTFDNDPSKWHALDS